MSVFDLKGGGGNGWNYSDSSKPGYMEMVEGTVVEISNPQSLNFATKQPETWPDGNPKLNLCLTIRGRSGQELNWIFGPRSKAAEACCLALDPDDSRSAVSIKELLGKFIRVQTKAGVYNATNPRPWWVTILGDGEANAVRGMVDLQKPKAQTPPPPAQQAPAPTQFQQAQAAAQQAVANAAPPVEQVPYEQDPTGGYYDSDIPF